MSDLIERLRLGAPYDPQEGSELLDEAADLIEALERELEELRASAKRALIALEYADLHMSTGMYDRHGVIRELRSAISPATAVAKLQAATLERIGG